MSFIPTLVYYYRCCLNSGCLSHKTKTLQHVELKKTMLVMCKKLVHKYKDCTVKK